MFATLTTHKGQQALLSELQCLAIWRTCICCVRNILVSDVWDVLQVLVLYTALCYGLGNSYGQVQYGQQYCCALQKNFGFLLYCSGNSLLLM